MEEFREKYGEWALVAGAALGIGEAFSEALARRGVNLLMVDIDFKAVDSLAGRLQQNYGVKTRTMTLDLSESDADIRMMDFIHGLDCRFLVYVAAYSKVRRFLDNSIDELDRYVDVNMRTPLKAFHRFAECLKTKGSGGMLIMSSLGSLWGTRLLNPYGATKAFDLVLAEALHYELKEENIDVMACVAGATATPTYLASNPRYGWPKPPVQKPEEVAEAALRNFGKKAIYISGRNNRVNYFVLTRILSRRQAAWIFNRMVGRMFGG